LSKDESLAGFEVRFGKESLAGEKWNPYHTCDLRFPETANRRGPGGYTGGISIKVGNMVPACCERNFRREHREPVLSRSACFFSGYAVGL
jgi:hypothetical protein